MFYKYFTKEERQYIIDCWELYKRKGVDGIDTNYRNRIARFNLNFLKKFFEICSIKIDDKYRNDSHYLRGVFNNYLSSTNYIDEEKMIAKECFGFDIGLFDSFSIDAIDLIDYKFKNTQINNLEDAYYCFKEYNKILGKKDTLEDYMKSVDTKLKEIGDDFVFDKKYIRKRMIENILYCLLIGLVGIILIALLIVFINLFNSFFLGVIFFIGAIGACLKILF